MKLARMYIENFMCHEHSYVNFLDFNSALIVGKVENNDLFSNGVGKSTIFKAIEYGLFNQADVNLEKIIRDDSSSCKITIDFIYNNEEYRLIRLRTKKNTTDISLYKRNSVISDAEDIYHKNNLPITSDKFWQDLSYGSKTNIVTIKSSGKTTCFGQKEHFGGIGIWKPWNLV